MVLTHGRNATPAGARGLSLVAEGRKIAVPRDLPHSCPIRLGRTSAGGPVLDQIDSADSVTIALAPGDRLGPYEILAKLGEGGMGSRRLLSSAIRSVAGQG